MAGHGEKLTRKQEQAIAALLTTPNVTKAAEIVGLHANTLQNWLRLPPFQEAYRDARRRVLNEAVCDLAAHTQRAVAVLAALLKSRDPGLRLKASLGLLDRAVSGVEFLDLAQRIAVLESAHEKEKLS